MFCKLYLSSVYMSNKNSPIWIDVFEFNVHFVKIRMPRSVLIERVSGSFKIKLEFGGCFHKLELGISAVTAVSAAQAIRVAIIRQGRVNLVRGIGQTDLERWIKVHLATLGDTTQIEMILSVLRAAVVDIFEYKHKKCTKAFKADLDIQFQWLISATNPI